MVVIAGYASLFGCTTLLQAGTAIIAISASFLWLLFSVGVIRQKQEGENKIQFRLPSIVFIIGFAMYFVGMFLFFPAAEQITLEHLQVARENGYQSHFEEHDMIGLGMCVASVVFGLPIVVIAGICATFPSQKFGLNGLSRYTMAFWFMLTPLAVGILMTFDYAQKAWHFQGGG